MSESLYSFTAKEKSGATLPLDKYRGQVVLIVNVASKCGFTPQYQALEEIFEKYQSHGFTILGFPCNQFGSQEPGTAEEIQSFCELNFGVRFPLMAKINVNGKNTDPIFQWLKSSAPGLLGTEMIKWNFTKFLIGKDGHVIKRYAPKEDPKAIVADIESALSLER